MNKDDAAPGLLDSLPYLFFSPGDEGRHYYATIESMIQAFFQFALERPLIIGTMHDERIFEWVAEMEKIAVGLNLAPAGMDVPVLAEESRPSPPDSEPIGILPDIAAYHVKAHERIYNSIIVAFLKN